jgi:LssY C-terminus
MKFGGPGSRIFLLGLLAVALPAWMPALNPPDNGEAFVGTWQAQFQGKPFVTVTLAMLDGKLSGTVSRSSVQLDKDGALTSATPLDGSDAISEAQVSGQTLTLTIAGDQPVHYEMSLSDSDHAELRLKSSSQPAPKPWTLEKTAANSAQPRNIKDKLATAAQIWLNGQFSGQGSSSAQGASAASSSPPLSSSSAVPATSTAASASLPALKVSDAALDESLKKTLEGLPRRVRDRFDNPGDMVNFVLIGSKEQAQTALEAANWHLADTDNRESGVKAVLDTYQNKEYLSMPMSRLYLFDRVQDFGYEEAEPYAVVASRHHFRLWQAPVTWNGQTVWVGAGTHDIGFEKDQRNGKITHKIDPAVDGERENIGQTLQKAGKVKSLSYYLPPDPVQETHNATGGSYHSDGRLLIVFLR